LYVLDRFDVLMSKIIFKKWKNIIDIHFNMKSYLKNNHYHTTKHTMMVASFTVVRREWPWWLDLVIEKGYGFYGSGLWLLAWCFFVNVVACRGLLWLIGNELRKWRSYKRQGRLCKLVTALYMWRRVSFLFFSFLFMFSNICCMFSGIDFLFLFFILGPDLLGYVKTRKKIKSGKIILFFSWTGDF
jgi:hypothetical protein